MSARSNFVDTDLGFDLRDREEKEHIPPWMTKDTYVLKQYMEKTKNIAYKYEKME